VAAFSIWVLRSHFTTTQEEDVPMVKVHVWLADNEHIGHAALTIGSEYVSFWPDGGAEKKDLKTKRSQPGMLMQSLQQDIYNEGNRQPVTVELPLLDEAAVLRFIINLQKDTPRYQIARNNCSHVVALALIEGAKRGPSFTPHAGEYNRFGRVLGWGIWTPAQVLKFARELQQS